VAVGLHPSLNIRQPALSKSIDIPHIFSLSASYELPWGKSKALGGFTLSAITIFHSGDPLDVRVSASQLNTGGANWANQTCDPMANAPRTEQKWFDIGCFADPAQFQFGDYRIGNARGPSVFNTDVSASKRTAIGKTTLELRVDAFNIFNKAHFANPNVTFGNAAFGTISATRLTPREVQLGVRFLF